MVWNHPKFNLLFLLVFILLPSGLAGCSWKATSDNHKDVILASIDGMPAEVKSSPVCLTDIESLSCSNKLLKVNLLEAKE